MSGFRWKLLVAVGLVVSAMTALGIYLAERNASASAQNDFQHEFQTALASLHHVQEMRYAEIAGRCDALVRNPRIHAALEDDALDLLYFNARDQLHDLVYGQDGRHRRAEGPNALRATFYRFLDAQGAIIPPPAVKDVGELTDARRTATRRARPARPAARSAISSRTAGERRGTINEVITVPIVSSETGEDIAALMVGFEPVDLNAVHARRVRSAAASGSAARCYLPSFEETRAGGT